ncbi:MAG TPA: putative quinol monooxygenase [Desulfotignum sp.]|jgi:quinol monooxygenase YgiN|nr:putative quinol monooxygenase [Desulfotignum sp.]
MIHVIASIQVKEGNLARFVDIFTSNMPAVLAEKGCLEYAPTVDIPTGLPPQDMNKNRVTVIEKWHSLADLTAHLSAPHMLDYREKTKTLVENISIRILAQVQPGEIRQD